jgi:hypothetical protein
MSLKKCATVQLLSYVRTSSAAESFGSSVTGPRIIRADHLREQITWIEGDHVQPLGIDRTVADTTVSFCHSQGYGVPPPKEILPIGASSVVLGKGGRKMPPCSCVT